MTEDLKQGEAVYIVYHDGDGDWRARLDTFVQYVSLEGDMRVCALAGQRIGCFGAQFVHRDPNAALGQMKHLNEVDAPHRPVAYPVVGA